jgi:hypothetical protein
VLAAPRNFGGQGRYCVIRDPAGAVAALFEPPRASRVANYINYDIVRRCGRGPAQVDAAFPL